MTVKTEMTMVFIIGISNTMATAYLYIYSKYMLMICYYIFKLI